MTDDSPAALVVRNLACERGTRLLFRGISFTVPTGRTLVVTGPNGSGKSSLLRILAGFLSPTEGTYRTPDRGPFAGLIGYLGHANAVKPRLSVRENLAFWATLGNAEDRVTPVLERVDLAQHATMPAAWLSAGQLRRLAFARIVVMNTRLWLLDEPAANLDAAGEATLQAELADHCAAGGCAVVTAPTESPFRDADRFALASG